MYAMSNALNAGLGLRQASISASEKSYLCIHDK